MLASSRNSPTGDAFVRKSIVALLVIAAIVVLISPGIIGRIAEESVDSNLQWAADESQGVVVTSERFDRGWFSSHGRHRIEIHDEEIRVALATIAGRDPDDGDPTKVQIVLDRALADGETARFTFDFSPEGIRLAEQRWDRLSLYAVSYADLLDGADRGA